MKKLMVLAAVAAMAMGAKAEWSVPVEIAYFSFRAIPGMDYSNFYLLLTSDFNNWQETSGTLEGLNAASWVTAKGADFFW